MFERFDFTQEIAQGTDQRTGKDDKERNNKDSSVSSRNSLFYFIELSSASYFKLTLNVIQPNTFRMSSE